MGSPDFAVPALNNLIINNYEIAGVVCQPDRPKGRGKKFQAPEVKSFAESNNLTVLQPEKPNSTEFVDKLSLLKPEMIIVAAYGHILKKRILTLPIYGCVNIHASLLPKYRGAAPIQWAIYHGDTETGITIMQMDEGMDTGDILLQRKINIDPDENAESLEKRLAHLGGQTLIEWLTLRENGANQSIPQNNVLATYARKLMKIDEYLNWQDHALQIHNHVRAFAPKPGLITQLNALPLKIISTALNPDDFNIHQKPGQILQIDKKQGIQVATGSGAIWIKELQPQNRNVIPADAFARGYQVQPLNCFTSSQD